MLFDDLRAIQRQHGYLPADQLRALSERIEVPLYHINGVAEFYPHFHTAPRPRVDAAICTDLTCHLHGADQLCRDLKKRFRALPKNSVSFHETSCLGQCDAAPAIAVNDLIYSKVNVPTAEALVSMALTGMAAAPSVHGRNPLRLASDPYDGARPYSAVRELVKTGDANAVLPALKQAGLAGMGGAGFPCNIKWEGVRNAAGDEKYVICNADESEPGTFKDRHIMEYLPHLVIEGMIVCAIVTGAQKGYLYIRHEYEQSRGVMEAEIDRCRGEHLLGKEILGSDLSFDIEVFVSPGGYICGEASALLEAIEGKRAEPRNKPPSASTNGLWQKPTALNNVETFANVPQILVRGAEWYRAQGRGGAAGLKFVGVSGDVQRPGVYEIAMGTPASEVIMNLAGGPPGGKKVKAFAPSGAAAGFVPASQMDVRLDFKSMAAAGTMLGSGAIVVAAEGRCMLDLALNAVRFFRNESCGKCVPCRVGSQKLVDILSGWAHAAGTQRGFATGRRVIRHVAAHLDLRTRPVRALSCSNGYEALPRRDTGRTLWSAGVRKACAR